MIPMLKITIPPQELWDETNERFINVKEQQLTLEHSLVSVSKWEAKWKKPFLSSEAKTPEEAIDYVKCMTITQNVDPEVYKYIPGFVMKEINDYIDDPMTATTFNTYQDGNLKKTYSKSQVITSELIYYWMVALEIPWECQKWHLNRLLTLIRVCNIKNQPDKKMSKRDILNSNAKRNAARRSKLHSKG